RTGSRSASPATATRPRVPGGEAGGSASPPAGTRGRVPGGEAGRAACRTVSSAPAGAASGGAVRRNRSRSRRVIRPLGPVPVSSARSMPCSPASLRTSGLAKIRPLCGVRCPLVPGPAPPALTGVAPPAVTGAVTAAGTAAVWAEPAGPDAAGPEGAAPEGAGPEGGGPEGGGPDGAWTDGAWAEGAGAG